MSRIVSVCLVLFFAQALFGGEIQDGFWDEGRPTPVNGINNPYQLSPEQLEQVTHEGLIHALNYPVDVTGLLIPLEPMKNVLSARSEGRFRRWLQRLARKVTPWRSFDDLNKWLGLHSYPESSEPGPYYVPLKNEHSADYRMGVTLVENHNGVGFTYSCAACHSANLFGKKIIGLSNRFTRANDLFVIGKKGLRQVMPSAFKLASEATRGEKQMYKRSRKNIKFVESRNPTHLGLDTPLAIVALSLSYRKKDEYASMVEPPKRRSHRDPPHRRKRWPRDENLRHYVADSKPGVWWLSKYKNRWLSDGSIVSGSPVITNLLWNEIGRGGDLKELEDWVSRNPQIIEELTTAVFNAKPPPMTDFFDLEQFSLHRAQAGQVLFNQSCAGCHGTYVKAWELSHGGQLSKREQLETIEVHYPEQTPVVDVGTDPQRRIGMSSLEQLNHLSISKKHNIKIVTTEGYVPQPLVGIWARWPYFHNNSIPNLCALMTPPEERPTAYYSGAPLDTERDFDFECNGYPLAEATPEEWKTEEHLFDTRKPGMSNSGHYNRIFRDGDGNEKFTAEEKSELLHYLQTL